MQYARTEQQTLTQTDLFHNALMATRLKHRAFAQPAQALPQDDEQDGSYSEMTLHGSLNEQRLDLFTVRSLVSFPQLEKVYQNI